MSTETLGSARPPITHNRFAKPALDPLPPAPVKLTTRQLAVEIALRVGATAVLSLFLVSAFTQFIRDPSRITLLLVAFTAVLDIGLVLFSRVTRERDESLLSITFTVVGSFYYLAFRLEPGAHLIPEAVAAGLQVTGIIIQICAKLTLRRSFGLLPANRGVVVRGPYRVLRHPIYFGYLIRDMGFLLRNFGVQNVVVLAVHIGVQACRIIREERVLSKDCTYREYMNRVRYRLIVGLF